ALVFDRIAVKHVHSSEECGKFPQVMEELEYLREHQFVVPSPKVQYDTRNYPWLAQYDPLIINDPTALISRTILENLDNPDTLEDLDRLKDATYLRGADAYARVAALIMLGGGT